MSGLRWTDPYALSAANLPSDCINLGQGYMNFAPPEWVKAAAEEALNSVATNHYSHPKGRLRLREAIKAHYEPDFGRTLNPETEILVTSGANEGAFIGFVPLMRTPPHRHPGHQDSTLSSSHSWNRMMRLLCSSRFSTSTSHLSPSTAAFLFTCPSTLRLVLANRAVMSGRSTLTSSGM